MVEDKKYMVSEDELVKLASKVRHKSFNHIFEIYQFLNSKTPIEPSDDANLFPNARSMTKEEVQREKEYEAKHSKIIDISEPSDDARETLYALADNLKVIHQNQAGTPEQDQLMIDSNIFEALSQLATLTPKAQGEVNKCQ